MNKKYTSRRRHAAELERIQRKESSSSHEGPLEFFHDTLGNQGVGKLVDHLQLKSIFAAGSDIYEQEADRLAARMVDPSSDNLQLKSVSSPSPSVDHSALVNDKIQQFKSGGAALDLGTRNYFEGKMGVDLSQVRVHKDQSTARFAQSINARAFTLGNHIGFGSGQFNPQSRQGKELLAHELVHTQQQRGSQKKIIQRQVANRDMETGMSSQGDDGVYRRDASDPEWNAELKKWEYVNGEERTSYYGGTEIAYEPDLNDSVRVHAPKGLSEKERLDWEYAMLSKDAYRGGYDGDVRPARLPFGWEGVEEEDHIESGYFHRIYRNSKTGNHVMAFRGTNGDGGTEAGTKDWDQTNFPQYFFGVYAEQYNKAVDFSDDAQKRFINLTLTGHSLGGGLATIASAKTGLAATIFNPAAVHPDNLRIAAQGRPYLGNIKSYIIDGELLNSLQDIASVFGMPKSLGSRTYRKGVETGFSGIFLFPIIANSKTNHNVWPWDNVSP
jgi:hypothetical protein